MGNNQNSKSIENVAFNRTEVEIIRNNWTILNKIGLAELGLGLMTRILIEHKDLKCMWRKQSMNKDETTITHNYTEFMNPNYSIKAHGEKVFNTIKIAVNSIDDLTSLYQFLNQMGYDHFKFGTRDEHFRIIGEALLSTLSDALRDKWNEKTKKIWVKLFQIIEYQMKSGMERAQRENL